MLSASLIQLEYASKQWKSTFSYCLLGFLASAWRGGREEHQRTHGPVQIQGHTLNVVKCSFNRFCTFGVTATGVLHYIDVINSIIHRDTDVQAREWLSDPMVLFALRLNSTFSTEFKLPFLNGSHHLGTATGQDYHTFAKPWWDKVLAGEQDPRPLIPEYLTLPHEQKALVFLFIQSLSHVFQKHLTLNITDEEGTVQTTNRWGETVFRYLRMVFERQQKTRILIIAALVVAKHNSFRQGPIANPMGIRDAMPHARKRLDNPKNTTTKYYIERFHNLLEEGKQTEARKQANARLDVAYRSMD